MKEVFSNIKLFMCAEQFENMERPTVYLAGTIYSKENPFKWHNHVKESCLDIEWINPFTIHEEGSTDEEIYERDLEVVSESDAILLRRSDGHEVCGAYIESGFASALDIPTVVYNDSERACPKFLKSHAESIHGTVEEAIKGVWEVV